MVGFGVITKPASRCARTIGMAGLSGRPMSFPRKSTAAAAFCLALLACRESAEPDRPENGAVQPAQPAPLPVAEPPLNREALLLAAMRAASAYAAGSSDSDVQRGLDGKRFEMRVRFGCPDVEPKDDAPYQSTYDPVERRLTLRAAPDVSSDDPSLVGIADDQVEALEGFWVRRPWLLTAACPVLPTTAGGDEPPTEPDAKAPERFRSRIAIAQFFTAADPRTRRRDERPYQYTTRLAEGEQPSPAGYDMVVSGRLRRLPNGRVVTCSGSAVDVAPTCVISVIVDHVSMSRGDTGVILAEWGAA
jgi:hypothetical protein